MFRSILNSTRRFTIHTSRSFSQKNKGKRRKTEELMKFIQPPSFTLQSPPNASPRPSSKNLPKNFGQYPSFIPRISLPPLDSPKLELSKMEEEVIELFCQLSEEKIPFKFTPHDCPPTISLSQFVENYGAIPLPRNALITPLPGFIKKIKEKFNRNIHVFIVSKQNPDKKVMNDMKTAMNVIINLSKASRG